jgi:hypothetical protein
MPKNVKHKSMVKNQTAKQAQNSLRTSGRKAPGTRYGLLIDWRSGSTTSGRSSDRYGRSVRDGK